MRTNTQRNPFLILTLGLFLLLKMERKGWT